MYAYHAAPWSSPAASRYRTTHQPRTKQHGIRQQRDLDYVTTWDEIDRWSVDPERVPETAWDSLEQCEEGHRRMEFKEAREAAAKIYWGGGIRGSGEVR